MWKLLAHPLQRRVIAGFLMSGFLFGLPGALLPVWEYQNSGDYTQAGACFLMLVSGMVLSAMVAREAVFRSNISIVLTTGCAISFLALVSLGAIPLTSNVGWRMGCLFAVGVAAGLINTGLFHAILPFYEQEPTKVLQGAGVCFGGGALIASVLVAGTFYFYSLELVLAVLALIPLLYTGLYARYPLPLQPAEEWQTAPKDWRNAGAILFALLLFFQFGNEWTIAGWLPLYLVTRLGISPATALWMLGLYWLALTAGRFAMAPVLKHLRASRLLFTSAAAALFGCFTLVMTNNGFGAVMGVLLIGGGFASIYPLVAARIGSRFPYYHPGFFNGIFSLALTGGMLAPWITGILAAHYGMAIVMILPVLGTCMVVSLLLALVLESRVTGR